MTNNYTGKFKELDRVVVSNPRQDALSLIGLRGVVEGVDLEDEFDYIVYLSNGVSHSLYEDELSFMKTIPKKNKESD